MCSHLLVVFVTIFLQVTAGENQISKHLFKRSPQQIDIQSIRQKQLTPEITVVDVVVNEPARRGYPNQNQYIQPVRQQPTYPGQGNYYPNIQYQNVPNRRQPEIQIIEVVDPRQPGNNYQQPQRYPQTGQLYPVQNGGAYPNNPFLRGNGQYGNRGNGRPRRPYRPTPDFFIQEVNEDDDPPAPPRRPPHHHRGPGHRRHRPRPPRPNGSDESESEEEKYIFDGGDGTNTGEGEIAGYTKDNFPIIPLHKNDIRR